MEDIKNSCQKDDLDSFNADFKEKKAIVIAGPTASGKSALALELAEKIDGVILNADSMQVYKDVPTLTARPCAEDEAKIPHKLYGFLEPQDSFNAFKWAELIKIEMEKVFKEGKTPVVVGGTGFYLQTLLNGISPLPEVDESVRQNVRRHFEKIGEKAFLQELLEKDNAFVFQDPQRMIRAFEVLEQTGKSITYWQSLPLEKIVQANWLTCFVNPDRALLYQRCNVRFENMIEEGIIEEVKTLFEKNPPENSLVLKAIGVQEIQSYLQGKMTKEDAISHAQQMTRNYAKRQVTWFKHRFFAEIVLENEKNEDLLTKALHFL